MKRWPILIMAWARAMSDNAQELVAAEDTTILLMSGAL